MLIYLDSNIVQYCADYEQFIFGDDDHPPTVNENLQRELVALRRLVELDQMASWTTAASPQLVAELFAGKPRSHQKRAFRVLLQAFHESEFGEDSAVDAQHVKEIERRYAHLHLSDKDLCHLAQAIVLHACWFLTNDYGILKRCENASLPLRVSKVSDCLQDFSVGLFLK